MSFYHKKYGKSYNPLLDKRKLYNLVWEKALDLTFISYKEYSGETRKLLEDLEHFNIPYPIPKTKLIIPIRFQYPTDQVNQEQPSKDAFGDLKLDIDDEEFITEHFSVRGLREFIFYAQLEKVGNGAETYIEILCDQTFDLNREEWFAYTGEEWKQVTILSKNIALQNNIDNDYTIIGIKGICDPPFMRFKLKIDEIEAITSSDYLIIKRAFVIFYSK